MNCKLITEGQKRANEVENVEWGCKQELSYRYAKVARRSREPVSGLKKSGDLLLLCFRLSENARKPMAGSSFVTFASLCKAAILR